MNATASDKVYDGTTGATVTLADNRVSGDVFNDADQVANFDDKNVGAAKTVTVSGININGTDAANYTLASTGATTSANITPRTLTVSAVASDKVYDGTTGATVTLADNRISGDVFNDADQVANFADKNVGAAKTVAVNGININGTDAANYTLASTGATTSANITPRALTVNATASDKVYDGTTIATVTLADNRVSGDVFNDADQAANFDDKNVGAAKTVTVSGININGTDAANYTLASTGATTSASITPRTLTVSATASDKVYDGTTGATVTLADNRVNGDVLTDADITANFDDKNVGAAKTVTVSGININGTDAANYTLASTGATTTANITPRTLTVSATASDKVYDGTIAAAVSLADNRISGDVFNDADQVANFDDKNVGAAKTVAVNGISINGTDAANYTLTNTGATTTANITPRTLTVSATGSDKVYDGTTIATVTLADNRISGDVFNDADQAANFDDKNVGAAKTVTVNGITINGTDAADYTLANTDATTSANITPRALTVSATASDKVYDGTTIATVTLADNRISGDVFNDADQAANFADKNVGAAKTVTVSGININGTESANYTLANTDATTSANITPRALTVNATASDKVYDGTTSATVTLADNRIGGDVFNDADQVANFADKNVGATKTVTVTGININGTDAANYTLANTDATTSANITPRALTVNATASDRFYDGTTCATDTHADNRVSGDIFNDDDAAANFDDKNVGAAKTVTVSGININGTDAANYTLASTDATTSANITPRALTVNATASDKVYDGTIAAAVTLADNRISGDIFNDDDAAANFDDKNVGAAKTVTVSGITINGTDAANYTLASTGATTSANITPRALTVNATASDKVYDGTTGATVTLADNRVSGDVLTDADQVANFDDKNVGAAKTVTVNGIAINGTDAANYTLASTGATTSANITPRALTVSATASDKVYDGTIAAAVTLADNRVSGDIFNDAAAAANFDDKDAGADRNVTVSGIAITGVDAANYSLASATATTTATITPAPLVISADDESMVYGSSMPALMASFSGLVNDDTPAALTGLFLSTAPETSHVGTYPIVAAGAVDPDYSIRFVPGTLTITPAALTITADDQSIPFGAALPPLTAHFDGFKNGDSAASLSSPVRLSAPDPATLSSGSYAIVASVASSPDYAITFKNGTLTIGPIISPASSSARAAIGFVETLYPGDSRPEPGTAGPAVLGKSLEVRLIQAEGGDFDRAIA